MPALKFLARHSDEAIERGVAFTREPLRAVLNRMSANGERWAAAEGKVPCIASKGNDMHFRIRGLPAEIFLPLAGLTEQELAARGVRRRVADSHPGFPDRVALRDAQPGERVLLLNFEHQPVASPYRSSHAIFVIEGERETFDTIDVVPVTLRRRVLFLRAFDEFGMIVGAELVEGNEFEAGIERLFAAPESAYVHAHYAKYGCYAARVDRAGDAGSRQRDLSS